MSASDESAADEPAEPFAVGYGKPPLETRFKPKNKLGRGRKKGSKGLRTIVREAFNQKVTAKVQGKTVRVTRKEVTIHQLAIKSSQGHDKATDRAIELLERYDDDDAEGPPPEKLKRDFDTLEQYLALRRQIEGAPEEGDDGDPAALEDDQSKEGCQ